MPQCVPSLSDVPAREHKEAIGRKGEWLNGLDGWKERFHYWPALLRSLEERVRSRIVNILEADARRSNLGGRDRESGSTLAVLLGDPRNHPKGVVPVLGSFNHEVWA